MQLELPLLPTATNNYDLKIYDTLVSKNRLTKYQAQFVLEHVSPIEISRTLHDIQLQVINGKINNVGAYTVSVFRQRFNLTDL